MLHNLDPILSPELLYALRAMGHGDEIALVDANFPAESCGPSCIRADGSDNSEILRLSEDHQRNSRCTERNQVTGTIQFL